MKSLNYKGSILRKLIRIILSITILVTLIGYIIFVSWYFNSQENRNISLSKTISQVISQDLAKLIWLNDVSVATDITSKLKSFPSVLSVILYKKNGEPIYQYSKTGKNLKIPPLNKIKSKNFEKTENMVKIYNKVKYKGNDLGYIYIAIKTKTLKEILQDDMPFFVFSFLLFVILSFLLAKYYASEFTKPVLKLVKFLENIKVDTIGKKIEIDEYNEFGKLYHEVNSMLEDIGNFIKNQQIASVAFEIHTPMMVTNSRKRVLKINKSYSKVTGYLPKDVTGHLPPFFKHLRKNKILCKEIKNSLDNNNFWIGEVENIKKNGEKFIENLSIQKVLNEKKEITHYVISFVDITAQKNAEEKVKFLMEYDPLTGFANKELFLSNLQYMIDHKKDNEWHILFCFNIKEFKLISDVYGYEIGDLLLKDIADRLRQKFKDSNFMAKIGIDEFVICYFLNEGKYDIFKESRLIAEYLYTVLSKPFKIKNKILHIDIRIGINISNFQDTNADKILKQVDSALQTAKRKDKKIAFFDERIEKELQKHLDIFVELQSAIKKNQFKLYYQLQYKDNGDIYGAEALIRCFYPGKGVISPVEFIPIAEKTDLILKIGNWVLEESLRQLEIWQNNDKTSHLVLSVNVSAKQLEQEDFIDFIKILLKKYQIDTRYFKIELLESILIENFDEMAEKMRELQKLGIKLSIDDFGTGFSSLQYLKNLPVNQLKIDQSFIIDMLNSKKDRAIVKSIFSLGEAFGYEVVAEGVETEKHYKVLKDMGCKYYQGYFFAKPKDISKINKILEKL